MESLHEVLQPMDLRGVTIWLSGAVPEPKREESPDLRDVVEVWKGSDAEVGILAFVQVFSALVFKYGGELVHGCHPSFTPILLEQSRRYLGDEPRQSPLHLFVSDFFSNDRSRRDWNRWNRFASLEVTKKTGPTDADRDPSLEILRSRMAAECSAFVAIGGKWWDGVPGRAGVPIEFGMATKKEVPCFVLGGFGGISSKFAEQNPEWYTGLRNGLSIEDNKFLASNTNLNLVAGIVVSQLNQAKGKSSEAVAN